MYMYVYNLAHCSLMRFYITSESVYPSFSFSLPPSLSLSINERERGREGEGCNQSGLNKRLKELIYT